MRVGNRVRGRRALAPGAREGAARATCCLKKRKAGHVPTRANNRTSGLSDGTAGLKLDAPKIAVERSPRGEKKTGAIFVTVPKGRMDEARTAMARALTAARIDHNL